MTLTNFTKVTLLLSGVILLWTACKKPTVDGTDLIPDEELNLTVTDTISLITYTERDDSVETDGLTVNVWGAMNDPLFGLSYAGIYTQFSTDRSNIDLGNSPSLDSLVLTLKFSEGSNTYGDVTVPQNMSIYRISEVWSRDSTYYNNTVFSTEATKVGEVLNYVPNLTDSLQYDGGTFAPGLRVKLDNALGQQFISQSGGGNFIDDAAFKNWFNGLYIAPDSTNPGAGMVYFDLFAAMSKLTLYYNDTSQIDFFINSNAGTVNRFTQNFAGSVAAAALDNPANDSSLYIKAMGSSRALVQAPYLKDFGQVSIVKAELTFTVINTDTNSYAPPSQMVLVKVNADGSEEILTDQFVSADFFGGTLKGVDVQGNFVHQYKFNVPIYYQDIINGNTDYGLHLLTFPTTRSANRVVLGGSGNSMYPAKLRLVYTKIE